MSVCVCVCVCACVCVHVCVHACVCHCAHVRVVWWYAFVMFSEAHTLMTPSLVSTTS